MRDCDATQRALEAHGTGTALGDPIEVVSFYGCVVESFVLGRGGYRSLVCGLAVGTVRIFEVKHGSLGGLRCLSGSSLSRASTAQQESCREKHATQDAC